MKGVAIVRSGTRGSVCILAVWALFFLAALAVAVGAYVSADIALARRLRAQAQGKCLARAGMELAAFLVSADTNAWDGPGETWNCEEMGALRGKLGDGMFDVVSEVGGPNVAERYGLGDEESRINVSEAGKRLLECLFRRIGGMDSMAAAELAACVVDWRDEDDTALTDGAEDAYYASLGAPYRCRNGKFGLIEELLLVKGMRDDVLARIEPYVTVHGTGKININTASREVLECLAESYPESDPVAASAVADRIIRFREAGNVFTEPNPDVIKGRLHGFAPLESQERIVLSRMMTSIAVRSTCFSGISVGLPQVGDAATGPGTDNGAYRIAFVYDRAGHAMARVEEL